MLWMGLCGSSCLCLEQGAAGTAWAGHREGPTPEMPRLQDADSAGAALLPNTKQERGNYPFPSGKMGLELFF